MRILVVDDNRDVATMLAELLKLEPAARFPARMTVARVSRHTFQMPIGFPWRAYGYWRSAGLGPARRLDSECVAADAIAAS